MLAVLTACSADPSASYLARDPCAVLAITPIGATPAELDGITAAFALWRDRGVSAFDTATTGAMPPAAARPATAIPSEAMPADAVPDAASPIAIRFDDA